MNSDALFCSLSQSRFSERVQSIPRLLTDALPVACDRVYEDFKAF